MTATSNYTDENPMVMLYSHLLDNYNKNVRPSRHHTDVLNVTFGFSLANIIDVDEQNQILTLNAWINQNWYDPNLSWDPKDFDGLKKVRLPAHTIWKPDIVLYNNAQTQYDSAIISTHVIVDSKGNVTWLSAAIFKSTCRMNVRYYPFDQQTCELIFASWTYDNTKMDIQNPHEEGDESNYMNNTEFHLVNIKNQKIIKNFSCCPEEYPQLQIEIIIQRKPLFFIFNLILPCFVISGIAFLGFYMPSESGEKVTLGITTLLSMTVFLMMVAQNTPPSSDALPLLALYYGATIILVTMSAGLSVFTLNLHHRGYRDRVMPQFVRNGMNVILRLRCFRDLKFSIMPEVLKSISYQHYGTVQSVSQMSNVRTKLYSSGLENGITCRPVGTYSHRRTEIDCLPDTSITNRMIDILHRIGLNVDQNETRLLWRTRKEIIQQEWQQVALVIDRFIFVSFIIVTTSVTLIILYQRELIPSIE